MSSGSDQTTQLQGWLDRLRAGEGAACRELLDHAYHRLEKLAHVKLGSFPRVRNGAETGDVVNDAVLRLEQALRKDPPTTVREFFGLASYHIRWVLLELARGRRLARLGEPGADGDALDPADDATGPATHTGRAELHEQVEALPDKEREVVDLMFYQGLRQSEAAAILGVSERTVKRIWRAARLRLGETLGEDSAE